MACSENADVVGPGEEALVDLPRERQADEPVEQAFAREPALVQAHPQDAEHHLGARVAHDVSRSCG